jgi:hypothetical protein
MSSLLMRAGGGPMAEVIAVADWPPFFFSSDMKIRAPFRCVGNFSAFPRPYCLEHRLAIKSPS